jgi:DNA-binding transcriptional LysR family regulator
MMDIDLLRSFEAVADAGSVTEAAARLHVSQSALSRRIQQLEHDLGSTLLVRGRHGAELTAIGVDVLAETRVMVERYDRLRREIGERLELARGVVRVGGGATAVSSLLPDAIAAFQAEHPAIRFHVREAGSREIAGAVADRSLELGVVTLPVREPSVATRPLLSDQIVLVARADHPLAERALVRALDLRDQPFVAFETASAVRDVIDRALERAGVEVDVAMELRSVPSMLRMVAATGYLAFVSRTSIGDQEGLSEIPVRGLRITRRLAVASRAGVPLSPAAEAFAESLVSRVRGS